MTLTAFDRKWNDPTTPPSCSTTLSPNPEPPLPVTLGAPPTTSTSLSILERCEHIPARGFTLRHCAAQLSEVCTDTFNTSETNQVAACFKASTIIPVPKKA